MNRFQKSKQQRIASNLKKIVLQFMKGRRYRPLTPVELAERLQISKQMLPIFQQVIKELTSEIKIKITHLHVLKNLAC